MFRVITVDDLKRMRLSVNRTTEQMARVADVTRVTYVEVGKRRRPA